MAVVIFLWSLNTVKISSTNILGLIQKNLGMYEKVGMLIVSVTSIIFGILTVFAFHNALFIEDSPAFSVAWIVVRVGVIAVLYALFWVVVRRASKFLTLSPVYNS